MSSRLTPPELVWNDGAPASAAYGDVYYSRIGGLAESRHVFLEGNRLSRRVPGNPARWFTVGETGFGTGLNFLALWQWWDALPEPKPALRFLTTELHPLAPGQLEAAHRHWPELAPYAEALRAVYPPPYPGAHRRYLAGGRVEIDFLFGDAAGRLAAYRADDALPVDAWFLDGFSPARNPAMWRPALYQAMARLSAADATVATFTAAGHVRRGLEEAGFAVARQPGFGHKRHMTAGQRPGFASPAPTAAAARPPVVVVGAGLAGVAAAWRLVRRGRPVVLVEEGPAVCQGASGNPASVFTPYFTADWSARGRLYAAGFSLTRHLWAWLEAQGHVIAGQRCGVLMLDSNSKTGRLRLCKQALGLPDDTLRPVDAAEAGAIAGLAVSRGGVFYPQGGWLSMGDVAHALLAEMAATTLLTLLTGWRAEALAHDQGGWRVTNGAGDTLRASAVVLACGAAASRLVPGLGVEPVRGQLVHFPAPPELAALQTVLNFGHYLTPAIGGRMVLGSTFDHYRDDPTPRTDDTRLLLGALADALPGLDTAPLAADAVPWTGIRSTRRQRLPLIGPVADRPEGLFVHAAHGSRGSLSTLLPFADDAF